MNSRVMDKWTVVAFLMLVGTMHAIEITDFSPKTIPMMGDDVIVTGSGFYLNGQPQSITCSARNGVDLLCSTLSDTSLRCTMRIDSVDNGYTAFYIWVTGNQGSTIKSLSVDGKGLHQTSDQPQLLRAYALNSVQPGKQLNYISMCTPGGGVTSLVIEGVNFGTWIGNMNYISIGADSKVVISASNFASWSSTRIVTGPVTLPTTAFAFDTVYFGFGVGYYNTAPIEYQIRSCIPAETASCRDTTAAGKCNLPAPISITDFNPKSIPMMGDVVTITGSGFAGRSLLCSAKIGWDVAVIVVSDTQGLCILKRDSVTAGSRIALWDRDLPQTMSIIWTATPIVQDNNLLPVITRAYVTNPSQPNRRLNYLSRCSPGNQIVLEGTNFGVNVSDVRYVSVGSEPWFSINQFSLFTQTKIITTAISQPSQTKPLSNVYYGYGIGNWAPSPNLIAICMSRETGTCAASADCPSPFVISDFNPKELPYLGGLVTITGSGFSFRSAAPITCSAKQGVNILATYVNDGTVICPFSATAVTNGFGLHVWDASDDQSATSVVVSGLVTGCAQPSITRIYVVHPAEPSVQRNFISRCSAGSQVVIEGSNLGVIKSDLTRIQVGGISFAASDFTSVTSTKVITSALTTVPSSSVPLTQVMFWYNNGNTASVTAATSEYVRVCMDGQLPSCTATADC